MAGEQRWPTSLSSATSSPLTALSASRHASTRCSPPSRPAPSSARLPSPVEVPATATRELERPRQATSTGGRPGEGGIGARRRDRSSRRCHRRGPERVHRSGRRRRPPVRPASDPAVPAAARDAVQERRPAGEPQLWVRVYPDECLVDGFEESLTETEVLAGTHVLGRRVAGVRRRGSRARRLARARRDVRLGPRRLDRPPTGAAESRRQARRGGGHGAAHPRRARSAAGRPCSTTGVPSGRRTATAPRSLRRAAISTRALGSSAADAVVKSPPVNIDEPAPSRCRRPCRQGHGAAPAEPRAAVDCARRRGRARRRVDVLPDRFVLLAYDDPDAAPVKVELSNPVTAPLITGPDPNAAPSQQLEAGRRRPRPSGHAADPRRPALDVRLRARLAGRNGVPVRPDGRPGGAAASSGCSSSVCGSRDTADAGAQTLTRLLEHHLYSRKGFELLRQGTPTNNTESGGSGHSWREDPDASFEPFFKQQPQYARVSDPHEMRDGQLLADGLGTARCVRHPNPRRESDRSRRCARDADRALAGHDRLLHGLAAGAGVRRRDRRCDTPVLHAVRQRPRPAARRSASACSRTASSRLSRSPGSAGSTTIARRRPHS